MPRLSNASQEIYRAAPRSDRPAITLFKSRSWSCSPIHFNVFGRSRLCTCLDVRQKLEFAVAPLEHFHYFWVETLSGFPIAFFHGFFNRRAGALLPVRGKSVQAANPS